MLSVVVYSCVEYLGVCRLELVILADTIIAASFAGRGSMDKNPSERAHEVAQYKQW